MFSFKLTIGKMSVAGIPLYTNEAIAAITPRDPRELDKVYLRFCLGSIDTSEGSSHAVKGRTLNQESLASLTVPLPPLPEQRRIAALLTEQLAAVERARAAAEAQREAAKALPAAYLRAVFESDEARAWPIRKLGNVSEITGGIQKTPQRAPAKLHKPYLTVRNVQRGFLDLSSVDRFEVTPSELTRLRLMPGDLLIVEGNGSLEHIGRNALFNGEIEDCVHQNHIIRVRCSPTLASPRFVSRFLNSPQGRTQMVARAGTTSGLYTLSTGKVASLEIPLPCIADQRRIADNADTQSVEAETLLHALTAQVPTLGELPAALLRRAFSGEG